MIEYAAPPLSMPAKKKALRLVVIDDHALVRIGLVTLLEAEPGLEVVAQGSGGEVALELVRKHSPDVTLLDLRMPRVGGLAALRQIRDVDSNARILILTTSDLEEDIVEVLEAGAAGYLVKSSEPAELASAIRTVAAGEDYIPEAIRVRLAARPSRRGLSVRELEVLDLMRRGMSNRDIGVALGFTENTAKFHVKVLLSKLEAADRAEAVARGFERGLLKIDGGS